MKNKKDFFTGLIALLFAGWVTWMAMDLPAAAYEGDPGPRLFPLIGAGVMAVCGIALMIKQGEPGKAYLTKEQWKKAGLIFGIYILFTVLSYVFGWTVGMAFTIFVLTFVLSKISMPDASLKKRIITSLIWTVVCGALIYLAYKVGLKARLPKGLMDKYYKKWF